MASIVPSSGHVVDPITDNTSMLPTLTIQPKPEPVDEDSLIAPPGFSIPLGMPIPLASPTSPDMPTPLAIQFPPIKTSYLDQESHSGQHHNENEDVLNDDALDIVPVVENLGDQVLFLDQPKHVARSKELVRNINLSRVDHLYYRGIVRKARMLYDAIRIYSTADEHIKNLCGFNERSRGDLKAATLMRKCGICLYTNKRIIGSLPGIEIGDMFSFRMEMFVVGLHGHSQAGIDFVPGSRHSNWEPIATSVVVSDGYGGDDDQRNMITYLGQGGQDRHFRQIAHQKMEGGNLALERSMHYGIEVRVIRGDKHNGSPSGKVYVYDGLYRIVNLWTEVMSSYRVYKYRLVRLPNQPRMGIEYLDLSHSPRTTYFSKMKGYVCLDISRMQENVPVTLFNNIDFDHEPLEHTYLVKSTFPSIVYQYGNNHGCDCLNKCSKDCSCVKKNGGQFVYDDDKGILIQGKPLIFECGPLCSCLPNCRNRVTQRGVKYRLEVFRSGTSWGVRSLDYIQAGSFICEYAGVVLTKENAQFVSMSDDNLVYPRRFSERWKEWGDLSQVSENYAFPSYPEIPPLDYAIDVSVMRNVASYIGHSTSPNLMVQFVLYDHNNLMFPRLMLFAVETIPPFREFSLDYGSVVDA